MGGIKSFDTETSCAICNGMSCNDGEDCIRKQDDIQAHVKLIKSEYQDGVLTMYIEGAVPVKHINIKLSLGNEQEEENNNNRGN